MGGFKFLVLEERLKYAQLNKSRIKEFFIVSRKVNINDMEMFLI